MKRTDEQLSIPLEHLHRYLYIGGLIRGRRVLDLLSREGDGARILAESAKSVTALDPDESIVQPANEKYRRDNLNFKVGSVSSIPLTETHIFDAVVAFDAFEETTDPERFVFTVKQLLAPGGFLIMAAPAARAAVLNQPGVKAFGAEELHSFLSSAFHHTRLLTQTVTATSIIQPDRSASNGNPQDNRISQYVIAIASESAVPELERSTFSDPLEATLQKKDQTIRELLDMKAFQDETIKRQDRQLAERKQTLATLEEAFAWHTSRIASLEKTQAYYESEIDQLRRTIAADSDGLAWRASEAGEFQRTSERTIASRDEGLAWRAGQVESLEREAETLRQQVKNAESDLGNARSELEAVYASRGWKLIERARSIQAVLFKFRR